MKGPTLSQYFDQNRLTFEKLVEKNNAVTLLKKLCTAPAILFPARDFFSWSVKICWKLSFVVILELQNLQMFKINNKNTRTMSMTLNK